MICQYYLRGTCKFGVNCRNKHEQQGGGLFGGKTFGQSTFGQNDKYHYNAKNNKSFLQPSNLFASKASTATNNSDSLIQLVRLELQNWEKSKLWPLSCFAPQKEYKCFPGFTDTSPEELRLEAYKCKDTGNLQPYLQGIQSLSNVHTAKVNELKAMTNQQLLQQIAALSQASSGSSLFSVTQTTSSLFGTASNTQENTNSLFGTNSSTSGGLFSTPNQKGGLFSSGTSNGGIFGSNTPTQNPFATTSSNSIFGSQNASSGGGGLFSSNQTGNKGLFSSENPFFKENNENKGSTFSTIQPSTAGGFSNNQSSGGLFGTPSTTAVNKLPTPFGQQQNPFLSATNDGKQTNPSATNSLFTTPTTVSGLFSSNSVSSDALANPFFSRTGQQKVSQQEQMINELKQIVKDLPPYQKIVNLPEITESNIAKYKADKFIFGEIPTIPPPAELCR